MEDATVARLTCPSCGEYDRYEVTSVTDWSAGYRCGSCGNEHEWERRTDGWWELRPEGRRPLEGQ